MQPEIKLTHRLTYKLKLTPQMRLGINLLQLPLLKLKEFVEQQIEENPLLEIENIGSSPKPLGDEEKQNYRESLITKPPTLAEHLLTQLRSLTDSEKDCKIGELIIGNINDDGYLKGSVEDIAGSAKAKPAEVEKVLSLIQTLDPIGVGTRDLRECLLLQLRAKGKDNSLVYQVVDKYLPYLEKKRYDYIARKLKIAVEKIKEAVKEMAGLESKPGRSFNQERTVDLMPDVILRKNKDGYEVAFNDWELPRLTLSDKYKKMLKQKDTPEDAKKYLNERLKAAQALINAVAKHKETIQKVTEEIIRLQKGFLDNGGADFKPMTLEQIAGKIGKHKSTVSRAVTNKYLQTPNGIFELRYFLNSGIKQANGEFFSSKAIKSKIKDLVGHEDKKKPLSDQKIIERFKQIGISIARRTVAKYRNQLKLLSSRSRQE